MSHIIHHNCIIAVPQAGEAVVVFSEPSLMDRNQFDGVFLHDNLTQTDTIPADAGVYRCVIKCEYTSSYDYYGGGTEYDAEIWMEDIVKIEITNA